MLRVLDAHAVEYVVIGGFAAWIQGAPVVTVDLDLIYDTADQNIENLVEALEELHAIYRHQFGRRITPNIAGLSSTRGAGHHLLVTKAGDLDVLRSAAEKGFRDLVGDIVFFDIEGIRTPVLSLHQVIRLKEAAGRPKDLAALPVLRAVLAQTNSDGE